MGVVIVFGYHRLSGVSLFNYRTCDMWLPHTYCKILFHLVDSSHYVSGQQLLLYMATVFLTVQFANYLICCMASNHIQGFHFTLLLTSNTESNTIKHIFYYQIFCMADSFLPFCQYFIMYTCQYLPLYSISKRVLLCTVAQ